LGIPNVSASGFPVFTVATYGYFGSLSGSHQVGEDYSLQDNFTLIHGKHTIKTGYELLRTSYNSALASQPSGAYTFGGTELPFTPNTGNRFANFLLGSVTSAAYTQTFASWLPRWWHHSLYVQDDWKPMRGLTLNLGLRWTYESPYQSKSGQESQFDPNAIDPLTGLKGAITHPKGPLAKSDWNNFQPRLGLAWSFRPKWVFRSSFGIMTQDLTVNGINQNFTNTAATPMCSRRPEIPGPPSLSRRARRHLSIRFLPMEAVLFWELTTARATPIGMIPTPACRI